jgi:DNA-binding FrmR family transcriptional regulator
MVTQLDDEVREAYEALIGRLRRVEGQIRGIQRLLEEGAACEAVAQQIAAAKSALETVGVRLLTVNMRACLARELAGDPKARRTLERITEAFARFG